MAKFHEGQKVGVPDHIPGPSSLLRGRVGTVTFVVPTLIGFWEGPAEQPIEKPVEQHYMVRFDGENVERNVSEPWLEPAD